MSTIRTRTLLLLTACALGSAAPAQESLAFFDTPIVPFDGSHRFERTLDLNGDGWEDAFGWYPTNNYYNQIRLRGYVNDGSGKLSENWMQTVSGDFDLFEYSASGVGDFNQDNRDDFAFAAGSELFIYLSNGTAPATQLMATSVFGVVRGLVVAELTGDAWPDVAVLHDAPLFGPRPLDIYENQGGTGFVLSKTIETTPGTDFLMTAEVTGDGELDLVTDDAGKMTFLPVTGGVFGTPVTLVHGVQGIESKGGPMPTPGDVDGDGDEDIVVFGHTAYVMLRRTGADTWSVESAEVGGPASGLADIDGDGDLDGVCCGSGGPTEILNKADSHYELAINDGTGRFAPSMTIQSVGSHHLAGAVDLDHDGDLDFVAGRCVYYSRGGISAHPMPDLKLPVGADGPSPRSIYDCEGDGDPDFVVGVGTQHLNLGDGQVALGTSTVSGQAPGLTYIGPGFHGDFDADGFEDVVVSVLAAGEFLGMGFIRGTGGGAWENGGAAGPTGVNFNQGTCLLCEPTYPDDPRMGFVHDFDGDGDLDLATVAPLDYTAGSTKLFQNNGGGYFTPSTTINNFCLKAIADITGDGVDDLWGSDNSTQGHLPGLGGGAFGSYVSCGTGGGVIFLDEIAVEDLDGDGDIDVATLDEMNLYQAEPLVLWNDGSGNFTAETLKPFLQMPTYSTYADVPRRILVDDVDGNGHVDLLWTPALFKTWPEIVDIMGVVRRNADNTGWLQFSYQIGDPTALADVDGDGDKDLVGREIGFSTRYFGPADGYRVQYGAGSPGSGGVVPTLGATGPFRVGEALEMRLRGAVGGGPSALVVSLAPDTLPAWPVADVTTLVDVFTSTWFLFDQSGTGAWGEPGAGGFTIPFVAGPNLAGPNWYHQSFTIDLTDPELIVSSNGLELIYGP